MEDKKRGSTRETSRPLGRESTEERCGQRGFLFDDVTRSASKELLSIPPNFFPVGDLVEMIKDLGEERVRFAGRVRSEKGSLPRDSVFLPGFSVGNAILGEPLQMVQRLGKAGFGRFALFEFVP